ncbi:MAG: hypothetical protein AB1664_05425 [Thermodesulfobacteriota bacterium]
MDDQNKKPEQKDPVSRRAFLTSLGKWSSIAVVAAVSGFSPIAKEDRESGIPAEQAVGTSEGDPEAAELQHRRWWGHGCRVWGHACRVWGHACRVWGNRCRVWGNR